MRSQRIDRSQYAETQLPSSAQTAPEKNGKGFASVFGEQAKDLLAVSRRSVHDEEISLAAQGADRLWRYSKEALDAEKPEVQDAGPAQRDKDPAVIEDAFSKDSALVGAPAVDAGEVADGPGAVSRRRPSGHAHNAVQQESSSIKHSHRESHASASAVSGKDGSAATHQAVESSSVVANSSSGLVCAVLPAPVVSLSKIATHGRETDRGTPPLSAPQKSEAKGALATKADAQEASASTANASAPASDASSATEAKEGKEETAAIPQIASSTISMTNEMAVHGVFPAGLMQNAAAVVSPPGGAGHVAETHEAGAQAAHASVDAAREAAQQPVLLTSNPNSLEVGIGGGSHGWLKIRAELTGTGEVSASLTGGATAAERLRNDLPALHSYLETEKVQVAMLQVHAISATATAPQERDSSAGAAGMSGNEQQGMGGGQQQPERRGVVDVPVADGTGAGAAEERQDAASMLRQEIGGSWLSVRA